MPLSGCSALHGLNPNLKKKKKKLEVLSSASDRVKLLPENFSKISNLDESGISFLVFHSRTNLKLHISLTSKMFKKVAMNLELPKASGPDCIP